MSDHPPAKIYVADVIRHRGGKMIHDMVCWPARGKQLDAACFCVYGTSLEVGAASPEATSDIGVELFDANWPKFAAAWRPRSYTVNRS